MKIDELLSIEKIYKRYPGVQALSDVSFSMRKGEVHGLVGANGAGKSTLIKIMGGATQPDAGKIYLNGKQIIPLTPHKSQEEGIQVIFQDLNLVPCLSVMENIFLGNELRNKFGVANDRYMFIETAKMLERLCLKIDPKTRVDNLSISLQQMVAIAKALHRKALLLIMDEATAAIPGDEIEILFERIRCLQGLGVGIIYVSHQIDEIFKICNYVTILRDGKFVTTKKVRDTNKHEIISMMVGKDVNEQFPSRKNKPGHVFFSVNKFSKENHYKNISFDLRKGEIVGFFGLVGAGRTELFRSIFGAETIQSGEIIFNGNKVVFKNPSDAVLQGIGLIPEERKTQGLLLIMSISQNISLPSIKRISNSLFINKKQEQKIVNEQIRKLRINPPNSEQKVQNLSGGNQQKVVLAKWLATNSSLLILDQPTRGIDVGAKAEIYRLMRQLAFEGHGIVMISDEIQEIMGMSDRVVVMHEGEVMGILEKKDISQKRLLHLAYGEK